MNTPCWVLRDSKGRPWDDEHDVHFDSFKDAQAEIQELVDDREGDEAERASDLHASELPAPCMVLTCSACGEEPDDDEFAHIHFPDSATLDRYAEASDWRRVDGLWHCFDCPTADDEDDEPNADRWRPGPNDVPLPLAVPQ